MGLRTREEGGLAPKEAGGIRDVMDGLAWEEVSRETVVRDEWIDFRRLSYRLPDGKVAGPFYSYTRSDYAVVIAIDEEGRYICVRQYRQGIGEVTTEFPAGGIEWDGKDGSGTYRRARDGGGEDMALAAARRELKEETGYESDDWEHLLTIPSNATLADNYAYIYLARGCRRTEGQELDETEFLNVRLYSSGEIEEMIRSGRFQQAVHVMAWYYACNHSAQRGMRGIMGLDAE